MSVLETPNNWITHYPNSAVNLTFGYRVFGLYLIADQPIPGLTVSANSGLPEIRTRLGSCPPGMEPAHYPELYYQSENTVTPSGAPLLVIRRSRDPEIGFWLQYEDETNVFVTDDANSIWVTWSAETSSIEDATTYLLGPVMAIILQLRGKTCLHGSVVAVDGVAIALLGAHGAGKSTSAAAFARAGYPVLADDIVLLTETDEQFIVDPAYPGVRLWPSSVELLFGNEDALPKLSPTWNKRGLNLDRAGYQFQGEPLPLAAVYILGERSPEDSAPFLNPVSGAASLRKLVPNSWGHYAMSQELLARQFRVLARLSQRVPVRDLTAHEDAGRLPQLCQLLIDDVRAIRADSPHKPPALATP